jgi:hypothetical protein
MVVRAWAPPVTAWAAGAAFLCVVAVATGHDPLAAATWARYDSGHYEAIARHGYELHRCAPGEGLNEHSHWCGNTAWFPAYPLLIAAVAAVGIPLVPAAVAIAWLAAAATLVLLWRWYLPRQIAPLACAAFVPGFVYLYAVFPLSLLTLAGIVFLRYLDRDDRVAGIAGAVAALAYPLGVALVPIVAAVHAWRRRTSRPFVRRVLVLVVPAVVAVAALVVTQRLQTGRWTAYFDVASEYGGLHDPVTTITDWVRVLWQSSGPLGYTLAPIWQLLFVTVLLAATVVAAIRRRGFRETDLLVWCLAVWLVPLVQSRQSLWRTEAALVFLAPLVTLLPRRAVWVAVLALVVLGWAIAHEFFAGNLV